VVTFDTAGLRIFGLGRTQGGSVTDDLHALGSLAQRALHGEGELGNGRHRRHAVPEQLEQLLLGMTNEDPGQRPPNADTVLTALDWFPSPGQPAHRTLLDGAGRGARPAGHRHAAMLLAVAAVVLFVTWLVIRAR
jgi:hypothetical protein